ncbi:hypothetical protein [Maribacter sp. ACAM166]|uniref:hypothetical protein n=1 Tax=Maribacter sp. ACAM166 TaxID=2508996 RepID=UPI0010FE9777|nr:hypothetical protein [Maribacter sp. ACAM166]TLP81387.1 hypothetical protein ES765_05100 [Maribacter sp. ACAM166]
MQKTKNRAISPKKMNAKAVEIIPLAQNFKKLIGSPECRGSWLVWGDSGNGKSTFLMQTAKELAKYLKVDYNSLEEQDRGSMQALMAENRMEDCKKSHFMLLNGWQLPELRARLDKPRSAKVIIIDSVQYFTITITQYKQLLADYPTKLFIFNSHADGKYPKGALADKIRYDSDVKIRVQGFKAMSGSRMSRGKVTDDYIIWDEGANNYWKNI